MNYKLALAIIIVGCMKISSDAEMLLPREETVKFHSAQRRFAGAMCARLLEQHNNSVNVFYSPTSIYHATGMVLAGAKKLTEKQMMTAMRLTQDSFTKDQLHLLFWSEFADKFAPEIESPVQTLMASKAYFMTNFSVFDNYTNMLRDFYHAEIENINFGNGEMAAEKINNWVENKTEGLIQDIVSPDMFDGLTRFALVNSLYFKAPWAKQFYEEGYMNFSTPSSNVSVEFIQSTSNFKYKDGKYNLFVAIPYRDGQTWMLIIMPKTDEGMEQITKRIKLENVAQNLDKRFKNAEFARLNLRIPKFTVEYSIDVKKILRKMNVGSLFSSTTANLSGISKTYLYVTDFVHKAKITVNKEGTEAAAASAVIGGARALFIPEDVYVTRPFIYAIYNNGNILFMGKMADPSLTA